MELALTYSHVFLHFVGGDLLLGDGRDHVLVRGLVLTHVLG